MDKGFLLQKAAGNPIVIDNPETLTIAINYMLDAQRAMLDMMTRLCNLQAPKSPSMGISDPVPCPCSEGCGATIERADADIIRQRTERLREII